jgi:hypothetical protein
MFIAETNNNLRYAKEERLSPELEELTLIFKQVFIAIDFSRSLQLYPINRILLFVWFAVPDCV